MVSFGWCSRPPTPLQEKEKEKINKTGYDVPLQSSVYSIALSFYEGIEYNLNLCAFASILGTQYLFLRYPGIVNFH